MLSKGDNFHDSLFAYLVDKGFPEWDLLLKQRIYSKGSKFFSLRVDPEMEGKNENGRVASPESV